MMTTKNRVGSLFREERKKRGLNNKFSFLSVGKDMHQYNCIRKARTETQKWPYFNDTVRPSRTENFFAPPPAVESSERSLRGPRKSGVSTIKIP